MAKKNPFKKGDKYHMYYSIFTKKTAPSDSDLVKLIYVNRGYLITVNTLQSFRYRMRIGMFPQLAGRGVTDIALQPRSCSPKELEKWVNENVR